MLQADVANLRRESRHNRGLVDIFSLGVPLVKLKKGEKVPVGTGHFDNPVCLPRASYKDLNVGMICGHGIVVVDVDRHPGAPDGFATLANLKIAFGDLPETLSVQTPNNGLHLYFRTSQRLPNVKLPGIDLKAQRCYVVTPPSTLGSVPYEWVDPEAEIADLPDWLAEFWARGGLKTHAKVSTEPSVQYTDDEVREMLGHLDPEQGREFWIRVGMGLHDRDPDSLHLWDEWSKDGETYPGCDNLSYQWSSFKADVDSKVTFGTVVYFARMAGWEPRAVQVKAEAHVFNIELPPLWKALFEHMLECSFVPLPQFAFASSAAIVAGLFQRRWVTPQGGSLGLYQIIAAPPAGGKDKPREFVQRTFQEVAPERLLGSFASMQGLYQSLVEEPNRIAIIDEFAGWLKRSLSEQPTDSVPAAVKDLLLALTTHHESMAAESSKANSNTQTKLPALECPKMSIFATMTLDQLKDFLRDSNFVGSGFYSRAHLWVCPERLDARDDVQQISPPLLRKLSAQLANAVNSAGVQVLGRASHARPPTDTVTPHCTADLERQTRRGQRVWRWASLHCLASGRKIVEQTDLDWGYQVETYESVAISYVARLPSSARTMQLIETDLKEYFSRNSQVHEWELLKHLPQIEELSSKRYAALMRQLRFANKVF